MAVLALAGVSIGGGKLWWCDSVGAIGLSLYILYGWYETSMEQVEMLVGKAADSELIAEIQSVVLDHHQLIVACDHLRAYHFGRW